MIYIESLLKGKLLNTVDLIRNRLCLSFTFSSKEPGCRTYCETTIVCEAFSITGALLVKSIFKWKREIVLKHQNKTNIV